MNRQQVYEDMENTLGVVPAFFKSIPDNALEDEWMLFKKVQVDASAIPDKYRELIGLGISAVTKCKYCIFFHSEMARLHGATEAEIQNALHYAKSSVGWSAYISGMQTDFEEFKNDVRQVCEHARKHSLDPLFETMQHAVAYDEPTELGD